MKGDPDEEMRAAEAGPGLGAADGGTRVPHVGQQFGDADEGTRVTDVGQQFGDADEEMPRVPVTRRRAVAFALFILGGVAFLYFVLPKLAGVGTEVHHLEHGDKWWIAVGVLLELLSFGGYIVLFRAVFVSADSRIGWPESYQITMAGLAATRLFAAGGAGGVALTAWALRRSRSEEHTSDL